MNNVVSFDYYRRKRNEEILEKFFKGESLAKVPPQATWFPPRPIIKKDHKEMARLYGTEEVDNERKE